MTNWKSVVMYLLLVICVVVEQWTVAALCLVVEELSAIRIILGDKG